MVPYRLVGSILVSRRSRTTLTLSVRLPIPVGAGAEDVLGFVRQALAQYKSSLPATASLSGLQVGEVLIKIEKKETVYL